MDHNLFVLITRTVGDLALKIIWNRFIKNKMEFLKSESIKETLFQENIHSNLEILELKIFYQELDEPAQDILDISEKLPEKINAPSIISI